MNESLLRDIFFMDVKDKLSKIVHGDAVLTEFDFSCTLDGSVDGAEVTFHVDPESVIPTNIHVLIGSNGVGKTRFMNKIAILESNEPLNTGKFDWKKSIFSTVYMQLLASLTPDRLIFQENQGCTILVLLGTKQVLIKRIIKKYILKTKRCWQRILLKVFLCALLAEEKSVL